jgi:hypothetical protein
MEKRVTLRLAPGLYETIEKQLIRYQTFKQSRFSMNTWLIMLLCWGVDYFEHYYFGSEEDDEENDSEE